MPRRARTPIVIADDHPLVLQGLREFLAADPELEVIGVFKDGRETLEGIKSLAARAAIVDVKLPLMSGFEVFDAARGAGCRTPIILLSAELSDRQIHKAWESGVEGLLLKSAAAEDLLACLRTVLAGRRWLPPALVEPALQRVIEKREHGEIVFADLSDREKQVARLAAQALQNKEIARTLNISAGTVKIHLNNIYQKLGVTNRTALAAKVLPFADYLADRR
jgi:DNA-binding NarL/FixJ family response regulator